MTAHFELYIRVMKVMKAQFRQDRLNKLSLETLMHISWHSLDR